MADNNEKLFEDSEIIEIPLSDDLKNVLFYAIDEAVTKLEQAGEFAPFTVSIAGEDMFVDTHPGEDIDECFASAKDAINVISHISTAYVFCYDGFISVEDEDGDRDAVICEVATKDGEVANAYALIYEVKNSGDAIEFDEGLVDLGEVENLFEDGYVPLVDIDNPAE